jgi:hypothetical protein
MKEFTNDEKEFIVSLNKPIQDIDINIIKSIINKMIQSKEYKKLIDLLNNLYDFAKIPNNMVDKLIQNNNKECISIFLENEESLYFSNEKEKNKLKKFLNVSGVNIKLKESYDYYYNILYNQEIRCCKTIKTNNRIVEHIFTKNNKLIKIKLSEVKDIGTIVSCIIYSNYDISEKEQILKCIDYINEFGFDIERDINNKSIIRN